MNANDPRILAALTELVGLRFAAAHRAVDMLTLQFGELRPAPEPRAPCLKDKPRGTMGDFGLHIQCPWRLETDDCIVTGRSDLWEPREPNDGAAIANWDYEKDGNRQDRLMQEFFAANTNVHVESVSVQCHGAFTLALTGGYRLVVFPSGSVGGEWRLLRPGTGRRHFVVSGGTVVRSES